MTDTRSAVAAAFETLEAAENDTGTAGDVGDAPAGPVDAVASDPSPTDGVAEAEAGVSGGVLPVRVRGPDGKFVKAEAKAPVEEAKPVEDKQTPSPTPTKPQPLKVETPAVPAAPAEVVKPPQSWRPEVREKFGALPTEVQKEIIRRERETKAAIDEGAEDRKLAHGLKQTVAPFEVLLRSQNLDPLRAIDSFFRTAAALQMGTPRAKAGVLAQMIRQYGVGIEDLASELDGQPGQTPQQSQEFRDPRFDAFLAQAEQQRQQQLETQRVALQQQIDAFREQNEFFDDLRPKMHRIIAIEKQGGSTITLEDAYNQAVAMEKANPKSEIGTILRQREAASAANAAQASTQRAKAAASSVKSQPASAMSTVKSKDTRAAVADVWEQLASRK